MRRHYQESKKDYPENGRKDLQITYTDKGLPRWLSSWNAGTTGDVGSITRLGRSP